MKISDFCIYAHLINGVVVYIGSGTTSRPYEQKKRAPDHQAAMPLIDVQIWQFGPDRAALLKTELTLIRHMNPRFNKAGRSHFAARTAAVPRYGHVKCHQTGAVFRNASHAAALCKISPGAIANHLNGYSNYVTVKGLTFERTAEMPNVQVYGPGGVVYDPPLILPPGVTPWRVGDQE